MAVKLVLFVTALILCTGGGAALECILCSFVMTNGQEQQGSSANCKDNTTNTNTETCATDGSYSCAVQYARTDDENYSWGRTCTKDCDPYQTSAGWLSCCTTNSCNNYGAYQPQNNDDDESGDSDDKLEQCYSCRYEEEEGGAGTGPPSCKTDVSMDTSEFVTKVNCATKCFTSKTTSGNVTVWNRSCSQTSTCTDLQTEGGDSQTCCATNLCNSGEESSSGADYINFRSAHFLSAIVTAVVMVTGGVGVGV